MIQRPRKQEESASSLRRVIQREFVRIRKRLDGLASKREMTHFRTYVDDGFRAVTATLGAIHDEVLGFQAMSAEIDDLRVRIARMERHLGLGKRTPRSRAAR